MNKLLISITLLASSFAYALPVVNVAMDWTPNLNHIGLYVAQAKGFYKKAGIDMKLLPYGSTPSAVLVASKKADIGITGAEDVVLGQVDGQPVVSVAAIWSTNTASFAVTEKSGITHPRELDGKIYASFGAPYETPIIKTMMQKDGGKGEFKSPVLNVYGTEAVLSGRADFAWIFDGVQGVEARLKGVKLRTFSLNNYGVPDYYTPLLVAHRDQLSQPKLRAFMKATKQGYEYAEQHPEEAATLMIKAVPKGTFPDSRVLTEGIKYMKNRGAFHEKGKGWGYQSLKKWTDFPKFLLDAGVLNNGSKKVSHLDYTKLYSNALFEK